MGTQRKVHNLRDSSKTHGTISNTTNIHPSTFYQIGPPT